VFLFTDEMRIERRMQMKYTNFKILYNFVYLMPFILIYYKYKSTVITLIILQASYCAELNYLFLYFVKYSPCMKVFRTWWITIRSQRKLMRFNLSFSQCRGYTGPTDIKHKFQCILLMPNFMGICLVFSEKAHESKKKRKWKKKIKKRKDKDKRKKRKEKKKEKKDKTFPQYTQLCTPWKEHKNVHKCFVLLRATVFLSEALLT
jgi:hypothetical protein